MAKKHSQATATQEPALFSTELYSSGMGDIEIESQSQDPYWDEIILDSEITQTELSGQTTLFYDSTTEPPTPEEFNSLEAYNAAYDSLCTNHPELVNHGFKTDFEENKGFKINDIYNCLGQRIFSQKEQRKGAIAKRCCKQFAKVGKSGLVIDWDGWVTIPYSFMQIEELQLSKIEELDNQESELLTPTTPTITKIKALTLYQPWAFLVGRHKHYETRGKATNYRGKIAIHAGIRQPNTEIIFDQLSDLLVGENLVFGSVIAIAQLTDCIKMTEEFINQQSETELRCGLWKVGRYAWKLENVEILDEPIPARGMPGLWEIEIPCSLFPVPSSELPITKPQFKTGEYILNGRVGEIIEASPGEYFSVKYGNSHTDLKCYFWGQDDELINSLAIPTERFAIAPQDLVEKFVRENHLSPDAEVSP
ncbi:MAG: hypothetical protein PT118_25090, partial [Aphanizomenon gracile PMC644.10]|nr:hypothetical protein [Aphanizomenon gracile PMC644.10]